MSSPGPAQDGAHAILAFAERLRAEGEEKPEERLTFETWVVFGLDRYEAGLPVTHVREILRPARVTAVPGTPDSVDGVMNLRGRALPVVDFRRHLGLARQASTPESRIVVFLAGTAPVGLLVDQARGIEKVPREKIHELADGHALGPYGLGGYSLGRGTELVLLDAERLFKDSDSPAKD